MCLLVKRCLHSRANLCVCGESCTERRRPNKRCYMLSLKCFFDSWIVLCVRNLEWSDAVVAVRPRYRCPLRAWKIYSPDFIVTPVWVLWPKAVLFCHPTAHIRLWMPSKELHFDVPRNLSFWTENTFAQFHQRRKKFGANLLLQRVEALDLQIKPFEDYTI